MIEELITKIFAARNAAHLAHWKETSGYRHETLAEFYDHLLDAVDKLVEAYQGAFELVDVEELPKLGKVKDIVVQLEDDMLWIGKNRAKITQSLPALDNILQELEGVYLKALYKLRNLK